MVAGFTLGLAVKSNSSSRFETGKPGGVQPPLGSPGGPGVAFGHHQFGEEAEVAELFSFGGGRDLAEPAADGGQPKRHPPIRLEPVPTEQHPPADTRRDTYVDGRPIVPDRLGSLPDPAMIILGARGHQELVQVRRDRVASSGQT
jgi:hypothetical protein